MLRVEESREAGDGPDRPARLVRLSFTCEALRVCASLTIVVGDAGSELCKETSCQLGTWARRPLAGIPIPTTTASAAGGMVVPGRRTSPHGPPRTTPAYLRADRWARRDVAAR